jgi:hypothetical protein
MNENKLFDEIARTLATPMPRRQALGRIVGGLAGAALAAIVRPGQARAAVTCSNDADCGTGNICCNKVCCTKGQRCENGKCKKNPSPS